MNCIRCSCIECRSTGLRRAASAGRRAGAQPAEQPAVQPQPVSAAIASAMQLSSNSTQAPLNDASWKQSAASADNEAAVLPEPQSALSDNSMSAQSGASVNRLVLSNVSTASKHQAGVGNEGKSELNAAPSDQALKQTGAGSHLPSGTSTLPLFTASSVLNITSYIPH